jgi:type VI protein secretion system component Hcp
MTKMSTLRFFLTLAGMSAMVFFAASVRVQAAYDTYLRIEGLDGSSKDPAHLNWIAVTRVVAGDLNGDAIADREASDLTSHGAPTGGAGTGKVYQKDATNNFGTGSSKAVAQGDTPSSQASGKHHHKQFVIVKELDGASPKLAQACISGRHFSLAEVDLGDRHYKLYDVIVASDQKSGGDRPTETIALNYEKIEMK